MEFFPRFCIPFILLLSYFNLYGVCNVTTSNLTYVSGSGASAMYDLSISYFTDEVPNNNNTAISFTVSGSGSSIISGGGPFNCPCTTGGGGFFVSTTLRIQAQQGGTIMVTGTADAPGNSSGCTATPVTVVLPVELSYFKLEVEGKEVNLVWETLSEINNEGFVIQRLNKSNIDFIDIGNVKGNGDSTSPRLYKFKDRKPGEGINYYRLKQVDYNGKFSYLPIRSIHLKNREDLIIKYDLYHSEVTLEAADVINNITIYNSSGLLLKNINYLNLASSQVRIRTDHWIPGIYFITVDLNNGIIITGKVIL